MGCSLWERRRHWQVLLLPVTPVYATTYQKGACVQVMRSLWFNAIVEFAALGAHSLAFPRG